MSVLVRFNPPSLTAEQYDATIRKLEEAGEQFPADGADYHVCFGEDGALKVSEIWDSVEQFEAFGERLMPILAEVGIDAGEPQLIPIHNVIKR